MAEFAQSGLFGKVGLFCQKGLFWQKGLFGNKTGSGPFSDAVMRMNFAGPESAALNGVSATRLGGSMRYNAQGFREYAPENLLFRSNEFSNSANWDVAGGSTTNNVAIGPYGGMTASRFTPAVLGQPPSVTGSINRKYQQITVANTVFTNSIWIKTDVVDTAVAIHVVDAQSDISRAVTNAVSTGTWQRIFVTGMTQASGVGGVRLLFASTEAVLIADAQCDRSAILRPYFRTTADAFFKPRAFENQTYNPTTLQPEGYLWENSATNQCLQSNNLAVSPWGKVDTTITSNVRMGASGQLDMDLITEGATGNSEIVQALTLVAGETKAIHFDVARGSHDWIRIQIYNNSFTAAVTYWFNMATGLFGTIAQAGTGLSMATPYAVWHPASQLWRVFTFTYLDASSTSGNVYIDAAASNGAATGIPNSTRYQGCHQFEAGINASSYVATGTTQVTRVTDVCLGTTPWFNALEGTFYISVQTDANNAGFDSLYLGASAAERMTVRLKGSSNTTNSFGISGNVSQYDFAFAPFVKDTVYKVAQSYKANSFAASRNGSVVQTDASGTVSTANQIIIGGGAPQRIKEIAYWNTQKPNDFLQQVTT
ncbi:phage head spike fiber domain-containing protein [Dyadobacter psychrotolerans]|uniref:Uncharacterized protein n=1 Tax=Dyadobacter psychrotolerans TaxID=2541721 RepID=A0A4R5DTB5_9BACT|nr:hypothetical protein [Dyadobacter psychrotolerans]TDE17702.1 hypothetical protein E0F88_07375 [Dyadobacter psychrotolerans]